MKPLQNIAPIDAHILGAISDFTCETIDAMLAPPGGYARPTRSATPFHVAGEEFTLTLERGAIINLVNENLNFSQALIALKGGQRVCRNGQNGRHTFLFLVPGSTFNVNRPPLMGIYPEGTPITYHGHIDIKTTDDKVMPWTPSHSDMLAEDWMICDKAADAPITAKQPEPEPHEGFGDDQSSGNEHPAQG